MEQARDIILVVYPDGRIVDTNQAAATAYGYSIEELCQMNIHDLRAPETRDVIGAQMKRAQEEGTLFRTLHLRRSGEKFPVEVSSRWVQLSRGSALVSIVRDITQTMVMETTLKTKERKYRIINEELTAEHEELMATEEELRQQFDELLGREATIQRQNIILESLHDLSMGLMQRRNLDDVLKNVMASVTELVGTPDGFITLVDEDQKSFNIKISAGKFLVAQLRQISITEGLLGEVYRSGKIIVVDQYNTWPSRFIGGFWDDFYCCAAVPLKRDDRVIGTLGLAFSDPKRKLTGNEIDLLHRFADLASIAIDNAILFTSYKDELQERRQAEENLQISERKYRTIFEGANDGMFIHEIPSGKVVDVNEKSGELFGYTREELLQGNLNVIGSGATPYSEREAQKFISRAAKGEPQLFEWQNKHKDGHLVWVEVNLKRVIIGKDERILGIVRDVSARKVQEAAIVQLAYFDPLTGLPNRSRLQERLAQELVKAGSGETRGALLFIDMDDLKMVNDTLGHSYGDQIIIKAGAHILAAAGAQSLVARIGGDEFIVLLPNVNDRDKVAGIANNMVQVLSRYYDIGGSSIHMSASIGIALYPLHGDTAEIVFKNADLALYAAKGSGKNTWRFYESSLEKAIYNNMMLKRGLRNAVQNGELFLVYQPLVDQKTGCVVSFEALLRWTSFIHGPIPPGQFIPLAEENDTIREIGTWVLIEACHFAHKLAAMGKESVRVSVNVSPRQLVADDFVTLVRETIVSSGIKPSQLEIEITENALIISLEDSTEKLEELRILGVHLSLDDFGTGYSSLTYLRRLPVGTLKIDKSFIDEIMENDIQKQFILAIINMAHVLGMTVVAEGVETKAQLDRLVECDCDLIQGYLFSRPAAEKEALLMLDQFINFNNEASG